jgi:alanine racemase
MVPGAILEVHLDQIVANFKLVKQMVGITVRIGAVVKSDAYGLGLVSVAHALDDAGCDLFFVADLEEASSLRASGITKQIVVFNADIKRSRRLFHWEKLTAVVNDGRELDDVVGATLAIPYFLNIETGFSRFGVNVASLPLIKQKAGFEAAQPICLFSHLACSDNPHDLTNVDQKERLLVASRAFPDVPTSLSASAALWLDPSFHMDIARIGSALYGLNNARIHPNPLRPVVRLRAPLVDIREVPGHQAVGYGATFRTRRTTTLGIVQIGYKHGLPWACANRISARLGEFFAPVVGRIAMEYTTIDLTDIPEPARIRGSGIDFLYDGFGVDELAVAAGVNSQEVLIRLGTCCQRLYLGGAVDHLPGQIFEGRALSPRSSQRV